MISSLPQFASPLITMIDLSILSTISLLLLPAAAKQCVNITVPFQLSARNGVFDIPILQTNLDATTFTQNVTSIRGNFTNIALVDYATVTGDYEISAQYCTPDNGTSPNSVLQFLTHGIGFDKSYVKPRIYDWAKAIGPYLRLIDIIESLD